MLITKELPPPVIPTVEEELLYPESDGKPMADNSKQFRTIVTTEGNLEILFGENPDVYVIGDMLWYPVEGHPELRQAPDVMVIFGRPKGDRGSYLQWREDNIPPQVVFEILSPGNRKREMAEKFAFYEQYGVEEYYLYDPDRGRLQGWLRNVDNKLAPIPTMSGWLSPRLGVRFEMEGKELKLFYPDGRRFLTMIELDALRAKAEQRAEEALDRLEVAMERARFAIEYAQIEKERAAEATQRAEVESQARTEAEARIRALEEKLRQAGLL